MKGKTRERKKARGEARERRVRWIGILKRLRGLQPDRARSRTNADPITGSGVMVGEHVRKAVLTRNVRICASTEPRWKRSRPLSMTNEKGAQIYVRGPHLMRVTTLERIVEQNRLGKLARGTRKPRPTKRRCKNSRKTRRDGTRVVSGPIHARAK